MIERRIERRGSGHGWTAPGRPIGMGLAVLVVGLATVPTLAGASENWPNWRGPARTGVSTETNLPTEWNTETNIAWKVEMPARSSTAKSGYSVRSRTDYGLVWRTVWIRSRRSTSAKTT